MPCIFSFKAFHLHFFYLFLFPSLSPFEANAAYTASEGADVHNKFSILFRYIVSPQICNRKN